MKQRNNDIKEFHKSLSSAECIEKDGLRIAIQTLTKLFLIDRYRFDMLYNYIYITYKEFNLEMIDFRQKAIEMNKDIINKNKYRGL